METHRSISGFVVTLGSALTYWKSQKQSTVTLSSCEAEYVALVLATKKIIYLWSVCSAMEILMSKPTILFCDNQRAIALTTERSNQHQ